MVRCVYKGKTIYFYFVSMSAGSRSIAAARQRRAGENPPVSQMAQKGQQQQQQTRGLSSQQFLQGQQGPPQNQYTPRPAMNAQPPLQSGAALPMGGPQSGPEQIGNGPGKLSVSDAFALVTLRLGKLETLINKWQNEGFSKVESNVDGSVIQSIVSRLEKLESRSVHNHTDPSVFQKLSKDVEELKQQQQPQQPVDSLEHPTQEYQTLEQQMQDVYIELETTKNLLLKLQSFTMETNQKLINVILAEPSPSVEMNDPMMAMMSMMMGSGGGIRLNEKVDISREIDELRDDAFIEDDTIDLTELPNSPEEITLLPGSNIEPDLAA